MRIHRFGPFDRKPARQTILSMEWGHVIQRSRKFVFGAFSVVLLLAVDVVGQMPRVHPVQELWPGLEVSSGIIGSYSLSAFGLAELKSPRPYRDSEYFGGLRISHPVSNTLRVGIECQHDRTYLNDSSLFLENRCAVDVVRRWDLSPTTKVSLQPKLELRKFGGIVDQRLKFRGELLQDLCAIKGTFRAFLEPAIDRESHGFEKITAHAGVLWPVGKRIKVEIFDTVTIARKPEYNVDAIGMIFFVRLGKKDNRGCEINR